MAVLFWQQSLQSHHMAFRNLEIVINTINLSPRFGIDSSFNSANFKSEADIKRLTNCFSNVLSFNKVFQQTQLTWVNPTLNNNYGVLFSFFVYSFLRT